MRILSKYFPVAVLIILLTGTSCKKLIEVDTPSDRIDRAVVFTSDATALSAIAGLYTQMTRTTTQFSSGAITLYGGLYADELYTTTPSATIDEYYYNSLTAANGTVRTNLWVAGYQLIFQANNIIEGLASSTGVSPSLKKQLEGEAKFIRAFCHFYLVNLFGDAPLITSTDYQQNAVIPRVAISTVYDQIIADLLDAKGLLDINYPSAARVRPNRYAASALLARVYLYRGEWLKAENEASLVINAPAYALVNNLNNVFLTASTETIWQIMPASTTVNTWEGNAFIPTGTTTPLYPLTNGLINAFTATDMRKLNWTKSINVGANTFFYPFKYKVKTSATLTEYYVVLRLAESILVRAEARANSGKINEAKIDLNTIRTRAGLPNTTATDIPSLLTAIEKERQLELFAEWGHRFFDLKRTGRANAILSTLKPGWNGTDTLLPIPTTEIQRNPLLTQNPGY